MASAVSLFCLVCIGLYCTAEYELWFSVQHKSKPMNDSCEHMELPIAQVGVRWRVQPEGDHPKNKMKSKRICRTV